MLTIEMRDNNLLKKIDGEEIITFEPLMLIDELNYYMNNGWKLIDIKDGVYGLEIDEEQLCYIEYTDLNDHLNKHIYYCKVLTHADAHLIRQYYDCEIEDSYGIIYDLNQNKINILDLRFIDKFQIQHFQEEESINNIDLIKLIKENIYNNSF